MVIFNVLIWFVSGLTILLLILTLIPFKYVLVGKVRETFFGKFEAAYGFLRLVITRSEKGNTALLVSIFGFPLRISSKEKKVPAKEKKDKPNLRFLLVLLDKNVLGKLIETGSRILKCFHPRVFEIKGVLGFQDPYYTGLLAASRAVWPEIRIEPDFTSEVCDLDFHAQGKVILLTVIYYGIRLLLSSEGREILRRIKEEKRREKIATKQNLKVYSTLRVN